MTTAQQTREAADGAAWSAERLAWVRAAAVAEGFALCGVAAAPPADEPETSASAERFSQWIDLGYAGEMQYLARRNEAGELLRRSARVAMPWARSVVVCALSYHLAGPEGTGAPRSIDAAPAGTGWIARYAWSGDAQGRPLDYHDDLLRRLKSLEDGLHAAAGVEFESRAYVDTGPLLERDFAARAGIGWIGRNTCVLNQEQGSWLLLGVIVTSLELSAPLRPVLAPDRCGSCTRCIDACPTDALLAGRQMDASRCIAYLTIEKKGAIAEELRAPMGRQVFGCDICQEVCPWNRRAPLGEAWQRREELVNPALAWLAGLDQAAFRREFAGSPLERTKRPRLRRNVAIAMGNSGDAGFVPQLTAWAEGEDAVLAEAAAWAIERLQGSASIGLEPKRQEETNAYVDVCEEGSG